MPIAKEEIFGPVQSILKFKWEQWFDLHLISFILAFFASYTNYVVCLITGSLMRWFTEQITHTMALQQGCSQKTLTRQTLWLEHWKLEQCGWTALTYLMLQFPLEGTKWVVTEEKKENTVSRTTCKWRLLSHPWRTQLGFEHDLFISLQD